MLFCFETLVSQKYFLKLTPEPPHEVDVAFIAEELRKCIDLPCHGEVVHKHTIQGIRVLLWSFED